MSIYSLPYSWFISINMEHTLKVWILHMFDEVQASRPTLAFVVRILAAIYSLTVGLLITWCQVIFYVFLATIYTICSERYLYTHLPYKYEINHNTITMNVSYNHLIIFFTISKKLVFHSLWNDKIFNSTLLPVKRNICTCQPESFVTNEWNRKN